MYLARCTHTDRTGIPHINKHYPFLSYNRSVRGLDHDTSTPSELELDGGVMRFSSDCW